VCIFVILAEFQSTWGKHDNSVLAEFPSTWGKYDKNPQTKVVALDTKDQEYVDIKDAFESTVGGKRTIVKIERVQNPTLYALYAARKKHMDQTNPPGTVNERRLYHGCARDVIQNIIHGGFNRSYAGRNGTICYVAIINLVIEASSKQMAFKIHMPPYIALPKADRQCMTLL